MSLQICPYCKKENSYWRVYKNINLKHYSKEMSIKCEFCHEKMRLKIKEKNSCEKVKSWFFWMFLPLILILLVAIHKLNFIIAILAVIIYHFIAMYYLIKNLHYKK